MSYVVTYPDQSVWWDVDETTATALAILRLAGTDVDAARIRELVPAAGFMINNHRDGAGPVVTAPPTYLQCIVWTTVDLYLLKDAPPVTADDFGLSPGYVPSDPLQRVRSMIGPQRERFGVR